MAEKAAVVIGVDKTGGLAKLKSAAAGASAVSVWLRNEGYDVECLTDQTAQVHARDIEDAVAKFVTVPPRYRLLVVYFSGHGYWHARTDLWLLSGAPAKTSDAINLDGAMDLARYSGIPNIIFISDACRSIPDSRVGARVTGIDAFPNFADINTVTKIDVFKATSEARSAYECEINGQPHSILTYALMSAYKQPDPQMIRSITRDGTKLYIVPNRELETYLQNKVNDILANIDINLTQNIEANVPSSDDVYIARVHSLIQPLGTGPAHAIAAKQGTIPGRDVADIIKRTLAGVPNGPGGIGAVGAFAVPETATEEKLQSLMPNPAVDHLGSMVGFIVRGARVVEVVTTKGQDNASVELLDSGDNANAVAIIQLRNVNPAVSVAIKLQDGRCAVLAGLNGYIGHASFDNEGLANVSYIPSADHWRWQMYVRQKEAIDRLRALVALAVKNNTFQVGSDREAELLGERIRIGKSIDPTLGLYTAHAYSQASKEESLRSVMDFMRGDLLTDLYDIWVLVARRPNSASDNHPRVPLCPMLTQTWNLLRPRDISLSPVLEAAIPHLCNSLWTTFQPKGGAAIMKAITTGELL